MADDSADMLQTRWTELYSKILPNLARTRDSVQPKWPVALDHCFARIILDNTVGQGKQQWDKVIKKPAVRNMSISQLKAAIELGEQIKQGEADLVELDKISLNARGKNEKKYQETSETEQAKKRKNASEEDEKLNHQSSSPQKRQKQSTLSFSRNPSGSLHDAATENSRPSVSDPSISNLLHKIARHSDLTPYRKRLYSTLLSVPLGCYTTYAAMAKYLESSARAVGNGMRNNPFAPDVPCHRVLAADGSIGGFHGHWGKDGKYADKKVSLLAEEGVKFDSRGKVRGMVFTDLKDLSKDVGAQA